MNIEKYMLPCLSKKFFGFDCPGCGMQRSFVMLLKGDFADAFHMFPAIYTGLLFFACIVLNFTDKSRNYHKAIIALSIVNAVIMAVNFIYKLSFNH